MGGEGVFWLYGSISLAGFVFILVLVPETKNKSAKASKICTFEICLMCIQGANLLADLGWVDLDLGCSITLLGQQIAAAAALQPGNFSDLSQPNPGPRGDGPPCTR